VRQRPPQKLSWHSSGWTCPKPHSNRKRSPRRGTLADRHHRNIWMKAAGISSRLGHPRCGWSTSVRSGFMPHLGRLLAATSLVRLAYIPRGPMNPQQLMSIESTRQVSRAGDLALVNTPGVDVLRRRIDDVRRLSSLGRLEGVGHGDQSGDNEKPGNEVFNTVDIRDVELSLC
jgi:hypothetical protein